MAGEDKFLNLGNNQDKISYKDLKDQLEKKEIESNSKFLEIFNIFDSDKNGTLNASEMQNIWSTIEASAKKNNNSVFENDEAQAFLDETVNNEGFSLSFKGVSITDLFAFAKRLVNPTTTRMPSAGENEAIGFLNDLTMDANVVFEERKKEAGNVSAFVNMLHEIASDEYAASNVDEKLKAMEVNISLLEKAANGQAISYDSYGTECTKDFNTVFKERFGVKFDEKLIQDCTEKANQLAKVKSAVDMINKTQEILGYTTKGNLQSRTNPGESAAAIIQAFELSGVSSIDEINKILRIIAGKHKDDPAMQKYGRGFQLKKDANGNYLVYTLSKDGYPKPAVVEQLQIIVKELGYSLDKALATELGVEYSEDTSA